MTRIVGIGALALAGLLGAPGVHAACPGPDLAVVELSIGSVESKRPNTYDFEISCVIRNDGGADYVSTETAQGIHFYESQAGDSEPHRLKFRHFEALPMGETLKVSRNILDFPAEGNEGMKYVCRIEYDAGLATDDQTGNDDCNPINNSMELDWSAVRALLQGQMGNVIPGAPGDFRPVAPGDMPTVRTE
ncbi:MAG TPA: hypothetical protein PLJ34_05855 [Hyphomicrobiales bacterium]|nr:hypothetical protein [Kaistiaceae bacterium]HQF30953.1 hypothetical protein [Hyphomicrobiales bacterium]